MCIHKLLPIINSNLFLITSILYPILSILTLLVYPALLTNLLKIIGSINGYGMVLNLTQSFSINIRIREYLGNIVVKNIKGIPLFRPRLLKLQVSNRKLSKNKKVYLNITVAFSIYIYVRKTGEWQGLAQGHFSWIR